MSNDEGRVIFSHSSDTLPLFLNGNRIEKRVSLSHGDVLSTKDGSIKFKQYIASNTGKIDNAR